jgi:hypothetical protein
MSALFIFFISDANKRQNLIQRPLTFGELHQLGDGFWLMLSATGKQFWKNQAAAENAAKALTGRKKAKPFWLFTLDMARYMYGPNDDALINYAAQLYEHLTPSWQQRWIDALGYQEMARVMDTWGRQFFPWQF